jgi:uncharacterized protein
MKISLTPRTSEFFTLFAAAGENAVEVARLVERRFREHPNSGVTQDQVKAAETAGDGIVRELITLLNTQYLTPFDREDIYLLAGRLDDVVDSIEAAADMLVLHRVVEPIEAVIQQARLLDHAAKETAAALVHLRDVAREPLQAYWVRLNELENEGDRIYRRALADLYAYSNEDDRLARHVLTWKDIVDELERAMDGMEHVADAVSSIVLKNA